MENILANRYLVAYSNLRKVYSLLEMSTGHILVESTNFRSIYDVIKELKRDNSVCLDFSDDCVDQIAKRGI